MAEYIEREAAIEAVRHAWAKGLEPSQYVEVISAADVFPAVRGRWDTMHYEGGILDGTNFDKCSVCGYERLFENEKLKTAFKYCPNCGAKIDGEPKK